MNEERGRTSRAPSRATSISRVNRGDSGPGSTLSRSQSLIRKQTAPVSLRPSDILLGRFTAWKGVIKQLVLYFQGMADIQHYTAREMVKLGGVIQVPFRSSSSGGGGGNGGFIGGEGGVQEVFYKLREEGIRSVAEEYEGFGRTIEGSIVRHLEKLRGEVKMHIKNIQNDTGKLATTVSRERELSTALISALGTSISTYKNTPLALGAHPKGDPYISNLGVQRQLRIQVNAENLLQKSIIITQANSASFEEGIVQAIQGAWATYEEWRVRMNANVERHQVEVASAFAGLDPTLEWVSLSARTDHLLDPDTPLREPRYIRYPCKDDPCVISVHEGILSRKRRYVRRWREARYVLTPAGFLHEFDTAHDHDEITPVFSLFLPECTLGPPNAHDRPGATDGGSYKFYIEVSKDGSGTTKGGTSISSVRRSLSLRKGSAGRGDHAWSFKAKSKEEMMEWWNDIKMLCARYLVASEQIERSGPVEAAVRAAGYPEDEDERSASPSPSASDEEDSEFEDAGGEHHPSASEDEDEALPTYSHLHGSDIKGDKVMPGGVGEVGENGFPTDKKSTHSKKSRLQPDDDDDATARVGGNASGGNAGNVSRRPSASSSRRSQRGGGTERGDEATEGADRGGAADGNGKSRFMERLD
ncbi:hypothetical protein C8R41DRAFT_445020 [Lentinula lateritia]|uniref:PH domain-containing protein n=1 Tax=Lentinula lateritia TaxID=40482 RepID=A0ABQ8VAZ3_9AGAR|nr:hypothetical protein C8R41DRAFT_445020 [Lentinula lateritia]